MKYIHVMRSGLDMAYSENQNQLALWGRHYLGIFSGHAQATDAPIHARSRASSHQVNGLGNLAKGHAAGFNGMITPRQSLAYWCTVHRRVNRLGDLLGPERFLLLNFDDFCANPREGIARLAAFVGCEGSDGSLVRRLDKLAAVMRPPKGSIGRHRFQGAIEAFDPIDLEYVRELGFESGGIDEDGPKGENKMEASAAGTLVPNRGSLGTQVDRSKNGDLETEEQVCGHPTPGNTAAQTRRGSKRKHQEHRN